MTSEVLQAALKTIIDPNTGLSIDRKVRHFAIENGVARLQLEFGYPITTQTEALRDQARSALRAIPGVTEAAVEISGQIRAHAVQRGAKRLPGVKNVIAVASGKGGVGKSTTAVNLALALALEGARAGLLDADLYGPSQPMMLGLKGQTPVSTDGRSMMPVNAHGIETMSIGFLLTGEDTPVSWRGPMASRALEQLVCDTHWNDLDYLIVDMPPGTGDIQLTLAQKVPVVGALIVTTPQDIALADAKKGLKMFESAGIALLGVVENMSVHVCSHCGHVEPIFGAGGAEKLSAEYGVPFLGKLPLDARIREQTDSGRPPVVSDPDSAVAVLYRDLARKLAARVAALPLDHNSRFPPIVVAQNG